MTVETTIGSGIYTTVSYASTGSTLINYGTITGTIGSYSALVASGSPLTMVSYGTLQGYASGAGVLLNTGGSVSNAASGLIEGSYGVLAYYDPATVTNSGTIGATSDGIALAQGGWIYNAPSAAIYGANGGILGEGAPATVVNAGSIGASMGAIGVYLESGAVINLSTGTIAGDVGVLIQGGSGTVINAGTIAGVGYGVELVAGGNVTLEAGGTISGNDAVDFAAGNTGRLVLYPGAVLLGDSNGGNAYGAPATTTLELAASTSASTGQLRGLGSRYTGFAQITVDAGAAWSFTGSNTVAAGATMSSAGTLSIGLLDNDGAILLSGGTVTVGGLTGTGFVTIATGSTLDTTGTVAAGQTIDFASTNGVLKLTPGNGNFAGLIDGLATGDTIDLNGIADVTSASIITGNTLAITTASEGTIDLGLDPTQDLAGATFAVVNSGGNAMLEAEHVPCFVAGTRLDAPDGPIAVEALRPGDLLCTASGGVRPVRWIGHRKIDLRRHPAPGRVQPIRIHAGALGSESPRRDLLVSPDHALYIDGALILARQLVNGASICQERHATTTYYHVELDAHDILLAEGAPAESYLDTGNRAMFENAGAATLLHTMLDDNHACYAASSCAPLLIDAASVEPIWQRLAARAIERGFVPPATTRDPGVNLRCGARRVEPIMASSGYAVFAIREGESVVRLQSRSCVPAEHMPWNDDRRQLGVMLMELTLRANGKMLPISLNDPQLADGWWEPEWHGPEALRRWTDGDAVVPLPPEHTGVCLLEVRFHSGLVYLAPQVAEEAQLTA